MPDFYIGHIVLLISAEWLNLFHISLHIQMRVNELMYIGLLGIKRM